MLSFFACLGPWGWLAGGVCVAVVAGAVAFSYYRGCSSGRKESEKMCQFRQYVDKTCGEVSLNIDKLGVS